ncbi:MAG TPA: 2-phospho-L-lactate transferase [Xanthobacteraceae bacterium]|nr:2-phospho-L-lactate transferase [Xanthobacteraceae bacterium]
MILALAGGVGGAKLANGLARILSPAELVVAVNTGDDFEHLGLHVSPDLDTVIYTLAGVANPVTGWGRADESWNFMAALGELGGPTWFRLGDRDLAAHVERTRRLAAGETLSQIAAHFCVRLGIRHPVVPMSDQRVSTMVRSNQGWLAFQDYFVRLQCEPQVLEIRFEGIETARPSPGLERTLQRDARLRAVVICPSNPFVSIDPILALRGVGDRLPILKTPIIAVSPIVGGQALKGPARKMLQELGYDPSALGVARHYQNFLDGFVIDRRDAALAPAIEALGVRALVADTIMTGEAEQIALARHVIDFATQLRALR